MRRFAMALLVVAMFGALLVLLVPALSGLYLFCIYSMPANSMVPVPHEPGLLFFAKYYDPLWVAIAGTLGSGVAAFADYEIVERAFRLPRIALTKESHFYQRCTRWFMRAPFLTTVLFSFTPLPILVVRVLAPAAGYSVWRYVTAMMLGRLPRFYLVAALGAAFPIPTWILVLLFVVLVAASWWLSARRPKPAPLPDEPAPRPDEPEPAADALDSDDESLAEPHAAG